VGKKILESEKLAFLFVRQHLKINAMVERSKDADSCMLTKSSWWSVYQVSVIYPSGCIKSTQITQIFANKIQYRLDKDSHTENTG